MTTQAQTATKMEVTEQSDEWGRYAYVWYQGTLNSPITVRQRLASNWPNLPLQGTVISHASVHRNLADTLTFIEGMQRAVIIAKAWDLDAGKPAAEVLAKYAEAEQAAAERQSEERARH